MSSGGGNTQVTTKDPYAPSEPYLQDIMREAENIYASDVGKSYFPNSTVVPFSGDTTNALNLQRARSFDLMTPSSILQIHLQMLLQELWVMLMVDLH